MMTRNTFAALALSALLGLGALTAAGPAAAQEQTASCIWERMPQDGRAKALAAADEAGAIEAMATMAVDFGEENLDGVLAACGVKTTEQSRIAGKMFTQHGLLKWAESRLTHRFTRADLDVGFKALTPADVAAMARLGDNMDAELTDHDKAAMERFIIPLVPRSKVDADLNGEEADVLLGWLVTRAQLDREAAAYGRLPR